MIGDYIVGKTLGEGSFGKVKIGIHMKTRQQVALKIIDQEKVKTQKDKANLEREIRIMKLLDHDNIVKMFDVVGMIVACFAISLPNLRPRAGIQGAYMSGDGICRRRRPL